MNIFLYLQKDTFFHNLHPVSKIIGLLLLFTLNLIFEIPLYSFFVLILILCFLTLSKSLINLKRFWITLLILFIFSFVLWLLFGRSFQYSLSMGIRIVSLIIAGLFFLSTTSIEEFTFGLNKLRLPYPFCFSVGLSFRLVPLFIYSIWTIIQAQKARAYDFQTGNIIVRIRKYTPLLVPSFASALRRIDLLAQGLEVRGFGLKLKRTYYIEYKAGYKDFLYIFFLIIMNLIFICIEFNIF